MRQLESSAGKSIINSFAGCGKGCLLPLSQRLWLVCGGVTDLPVLVGHTLADSSGPALKTGIWGAPRLQSAGLGMSERGPRRSPRLWRP